MIELDSLRLDKWLWAARFYKTRKLAAEAVLGGKVHLNGQRSKPGKEIKVNSRLEIHKETYQWDLTVIGLNNQRRPAKEAVLLYQETKSSYEQRQQQIKQQREQRLLLPPEDRPHKPNKKQRRQIHQFKQG